MSSAARDATRTARGAMDEPRSRCESVRWWRHRSANRRLDDERQLKRINSLSLHRSAEPPGHSRARRAVHARGVEASRNHDPGTWRQRLEPRRMSEEGSTSTCTCASGGPIRWSTSRARKGESATRSISTCTRKCCSGRACCSRGHEGLILDSLELEHELPLHCRWVVAVVLDVDEQRLHAFGRAFDDFFRYPPRASPCRSAAG